MMVSTLVMGTCADATSYSAHAFSRAISPSSIAVFAAARSVFICVYSLDERARADVIFCCASLYFVSATEVSILRADFSSI
jgi:hypothetical protein